MERQLLVNDNPVENIGLNLRLPNNVFDNAKWNSIIEKLAAAVANKRDEEIKNNVEQWLKSGKPDGFHFKVCNTSYTFKKEGDDFNLAICQGLGW